MEMSYSAPRRIADMDATDQGPDTADETNTTLQEVREMWANGEPSDVALQTEGWPDLQVSGKIGTVPPGFYVESTHLTVSGRGVFVNPHIPVACEYLGDEGLHMWALRYDPAQGCGTALGLAKLVEIDADRNARETLGIDEP